MSSLQQLYCTHCTYGTSALRREKGELANEPLGYSVRAASLAGNPLRVAYSRVEAYLHYSLPQGSELGPEAPDRPSPPKRLFLARLENGTDLLGQVCYRETDTTGRQGSYFSHVFLSEPSNGGRLSELGSLRLWGSAIWQEGDSSELSFDLPSPDAASTFSTSGQEYCSDEVFWEFLNTPPAQPFTERAGPLPSRWRVMSAPKRRELFLRVFTAALKAFDEAESRLIALCEPEIAPLLFYGVFRLIPDLPLREPYSFSTFESNPDKITSTLSAVPVAAPAQRTHTIAQFENRGRIVDTYADTSEEVATSASRYAHLLVTNLIESGWREVDGIRNGVGKLELRRPSEWEKASALHEIADQILDPDRKAAAAINSASQFGLSYLQDLLFRKLEQYPFPAAQLAFLVGSADHVPLLMVICRSVQHSDAITKVVRFLLQTLSPEDLARVVMCPTIAAEHRLFALTGHLSKAGCVPDGARALWHAQPERFLDGSARPLLTAALQSVDKSVRERILTSIDAESRPAFFRAAAVPFSWKHSTLLSYVRQHRRLPPNCDFLWDLQMPAQHAKDLLLTSIVRTLDVTRSADLLANAPDDKLAAVLSCNSLPIDSRTLALTAYMRKRRTLPTPANELLVLDRTRKRPLKHSILVLAINSTDPSTLVAVANSLDAARRYRLIRFLQSAASAPAPPTNRDKPTECEGNVRSLAALSHIIAGLPHVELLGLFEQYRDDFFRAHPSDEAHLAKRLAEVLGTLYASAHFRAEFDFVTAGETFLALGERETLSRWKRCIAAIGTLSRCEIENRPWRQWGHALRDLARDFFEILPEETRKNKAGGVVMKRLCSLATQYLERSFLSENSRNDKVRTARSALAYAFNHGGMLSDTRRQRDWWFIWTVILCALVLLSGLAAAVWYFQDEICTFIHGLMDKAFQRSS